MSAPNKEGFLQELNADTWCGYIWCRRLYGYQYTDPDFLRRVYDRLDELGRDKVKYIYALYVKLEIAYQMEQEREAGAWLVEQIDKDYERKVKEAKWQKKRELLARRQQLLMQKSQI